MSLRLKNFIWGDGTGWRLPKAFFRDASRKYPQFASSKQKMIQVIFEFDDTETWLAYLDITGHFLRFDHNGGIDREWQHREIDAALSRTRTSPAHIERMKRKPVVNLNLVRNLITERTEIESTIMWKPTEADQRLVIQDLLEKPLPLLKRTEQKNLTD